jgi:hypothetical protein
MNKDDAVNLIARKNIAFRLVLDRVTRWNPGMTVEENAGMLGMKETAACRFKQNYGLGFRRKGPAGRKQRPPNTKERWAILALRLGIRPFRVGKMFNIDRSNITKVAMKWER